MTRLIESNGWFVARDCVSTALLDTICAQFPAGEVRRAAIRQRNGVEGNNDGTLHHVLADHPAYLELLDQLRPFEDFMREFLGSKFILNSYGGLINRAGTTAYVHNVHRDIRFGSPNRRFMINLLVMLDDFTLENGATWLLSGSQGEPEKPSEERFEREASRATAGRGSILFFDSRIWHATGRNTTSKERRALTLTFTSPFFKPQLDYPRLLGADHPATGDAFLRQVIGYNARVPATLDEYYVPVAKRCYQRGQDD